VVNLHCFITVARCDSRCSILPCKIGIYRAVVGGTAGTAMAVPLFGTIMIFKITDFEFSFPLKKILSFYFSLAFKPK